MLNWSEGPAVPVLFEAALAVKRGCFTATWCLSLPADPYVKVWLMHKDKRVEKKKTVVMKRCLNPVFNESFPFDVPAHVLRETTIIITVMDKDKLSRNDVIGKVSSSFFLLLLLAAFLLLFQSDPVTADLRQSLLTPAGADACTGREPAPIHLALKL